MKNVLVIFGGISAEHDVSIASARNVINSIVKAGYNALPLYINKDDKWFMSEDVNQYDLKDLSLFKIPFNYNKLGNEVTVNDKTYSIFKAFPILHGKGGEDGKIQKELEDLNISYVGCSVASSMICIDKIKTKKILKEHNIPVVKDFCINRK